MKAFFTIWTMGAAFTLGVLSAIGGCALAFALAKSGAKRFNRIFNGMKQKQHAAKRKQNKTQRIK